MLFGNFIVYRKTFKSNAFIELNDSMRINVNSIHIELTLISKISKISKNFKFDHIKVCKGFQVTVSKKSFH